MRVVVVRKCLFGLQGTACKHGAHVRAGMPTLVTGTLVPEILELRVSNTLTFAFLLPLPKGSVPCYFLVDNWCKRFHCRGEVGRLHNPDCQTITLVF